MRRIDYGPGDKVVCIKRIDPDRCWGRTPFPVPQIGVVYTCVTVDEHPRKPGFFGVILAEYGDMVAYRWNAYYFRKWQPIEEPKRQVAARELEDA
jgi:hypothetical protein